MLTRYIVTGIVAVAVAASGARAQSVEPLGVSVLRLPEGGLQPRCMTDTGGVLHLVCFKGEAANGDLWYTTLKPGSDAFTKPSRVNSQEQSAVAVGTIRGPQLAIGRAGRVHVAWNGSGKALPKGPKSPSGAESAPMLYSRLNDERTAFEPQRCVATSSTAIDGGGSVAADQDGRVYVGWQAAQPSGPAKEADRQFWLASSTDDGRTFTRERAASPRELGACACCGTAGFTDAAGGVHFLFRAARGNENRDMQWLRSADHGATFTATALQLWKANQCPMSSASIVQQPGPGGKVVLAWETQGQVAFTIADPSTGKVGPIVTPEGAPKNRKHPSAAVAPDGSILLAWSEGTGWNRGGDVCWQVFDQQGKPVAEGQQRREGAQGLQVWNAPAVAWQGTRFLVIY